MAAIIQELLKREPWRARQGQPRNALQLDWLDEPAHCTGEIEFEQNSRWWLCRECGYCSCWSNTTHCKPEHPHDFHTASLSFFYKRRIEQGLTPELAKQQAEHIIGIALRTAAKLRPEDLARYVDQHLLLND